MSETEGLVTEMKEYKQIRTHKIIRQKIRSLIQTKRKFRAVLNLTSSCIVFQDSCKNFSVDVLDKQVALYDQNTYVQCKFDKVHQQTKPFLEQFDVINQKQTNFLTIYFQLPQKSRNIFMNQYEAEKSLKDRKQTDKQLGIVQRATKSLLNKISSDKNEELVVSVVGIKDQAMVDLLNFDQDFSDKQSMKKIKLKKPQGKLQVENMIQVGIYNQKTINTVMMLATFLRAAHLQKTGEQLEAIVYQIGIAKLSDKRDEIKEMVQKFNFVKINGDSSSLHSLGSCLKQLTENYPKISTRNSKLTFFLEDCLQQNTQIHLIYEIDGGSTIKSQTNILSFGSYIDRPIVMKKNYIGDQEVIDKLKQYGNQMTLKNLLTLHNRQQNIRHLKTQKLGLKYDVSVNRSLLSETRSSLYKRRQPSAHRMSETKETNISSRLADTERYKKLRRIYRDI